MPIQNVLPRDAIPSIDDPEFAADYFGEPEDTVVVVDGEPPRAYPIRVLSYHEIVNDAVDGEPLAMTWCPICGSAVVYERTVDGQVLTFGVSGKLADDALVMYDRETGSEWKQPTGECLAGPLSGRRLSVVPAQLVTYERFATDHPDGVVLQPVRAGGPGEPAPRQVYEMERYERYFEDDAFGLKGMRGTGPERSWNHEDLHPKTVVLGVEHGGDAVGYPLPRVVDAGVVTDRVGGRDVVVVAVDGELHAFADPGHDLAWRDGELRGGGTAWDATTGESDDGRRLERLPARRVFAFSWQDDHGPASFWSA